MKSSKNNLHCEYTNDRLPSGMGPAAVLGVGHLS